MKDFIRSAGMEHNTRHDLTKRHFVRLNHRIKIALTIPALHKTIHAHSNNVSESGIFIKSDKIIPVGTQVEITLYPYKNEKKKVSGKVIWICEAADRENAGYAVLTPEVNLLSLLGLSYVYEENKREFVRISRQMKALLIGGNGKKQKIKGLTRNISYQGMFVLAKKNLPVYSTVNIELYPFREDPIELKGIVAWVNQTQDKQNRGMGLYLSTEVDFSIPGQDHERQSRMIQRYIEYINHLKRKPL